MISASNRAWGGLMLLGFCFSCFHSEQAHESQARQENHMQSIIPQLEVFQNENGLYGYRDAQTGEVLIEAQYTGALPFANNLAAVSQDYDLDHIHIRWWGYVDPFGEVQIPFIFSEAHPHDQIYELFEDSKIIVAPVKISSIVIGSDHDNPRIDYSYYVDLLGNCIPPEGSENLYQHPAQVFFESKGPHKGFHVFFEAIGQTKMSEVEKKDLEMMMILQLTSGVVDRILRGEVKMKMNGHHSLKEIGLGVSAKRAQVVQAYMRSLFPTLDQDAYYLPMEDKGSAEVDTSLGFDSEGDRRVWVEFVEVAQE